MRTKPSPCWQCPTRHVGCHGECLQYQAYRDEREEIYVERERSLRLLEMTLDSTFKTRHIKPMDRPRR